MDINTHIKAVNVQLARMLLMSLSAFEGSVRWTDYERDFKARAQEWNDERHTRNGRYFSFISPHLPSYYTLTHETAVDKVCAHHQIDDPHFKQLIVSMMLGMWNESQDWARDVLLADGMSEEAIKQLYSSYNDMYTQLDGFFDRLYDDANLHVHTEEKANG